MFESLSEKFRGVLSYFSGKKVVTESNIAEAVLQVRAALLEADVHYDVVDPFVERLQKRALGTEVLKSVSPGEQFIHVVHEEIISLMGGEEATLDMKGKCSVFMLCGLQGAGKTTSCVKLAAWILKKKPYKKVLLAACDLQRPAAIEQLKKLAGEQGIPVHTIEGEKDPRVVARAALQRGKAEQFDVLIVDTAGRLHIDDALMSELTDLKTLLEPREILFVANAATGQDAARSAAEFGSRLKMTGSILTMLDGNARAGAALSLREVTKKPLKFEGIGERVADFQLFHPRSMADRILGMGDVINLVRRAQEQFDDADQARMQEKFRKSSFTYEDYLAQMQKMKQMGPLTNLLKMIPGASAAMADMSVPEQKFKQAEAVIHSMTLRERQERDELTISRRKRLAAGSGISFDDVNRLTKDFERAKQMMKGMSHKQMPDLNKMNMQGSRKKWR
jgi:signal recognition particle subunit SRP54